MWPGYKWSWAGCGPRAVSSTALVQTILDRRCNEEASNKWNE